MISPFFAGRNGTIPWKNVKNLYIKTFWNIEMPKSTLPLLLAQQIKHACHLRLNERAVKLPSDAIRRYGGWCYFSPATISDLSDFQAICGSFRLWCVITLFQSWCTWGGFYHLVADIFAKHNSERTKHHPLQNQEGHLVKNPPLQIFIALAWRKSTLRWVCLTSQPHFFQTFSLLLASSKSASAWNKLQWATKKKQRAGYEIHEILIVSGSW